MPLVSAQMPDGQFKDFEIPEGMGLQQARSIIQAHYHQENDSTAATAPRGPFAARSLPGLPKLPGLPDVPRPDLSEFYRYTTKPQQPLLQLLLNSPRQPQQQPQQPQRSQLWPQPQMQPQMPNEFPRFETNNSLRDFVHQMLGPDAATAFDKPNRQYGNMLLNSPPRNYAMKDPTVQRALGSGFNSLADMVDPSLYRRTPDAGESW